MQTQWPVNLYKIRIHTWLYSGPVCLEQPSHGRSQRQWTDTTLAGRRVPKNSAKTWIWICEDFFFFQTPLRFKAQRANCFSSDWSPPHTAVECGFSPALPGEPTANFWAVAALLTTSKSFRMEPACAHTGSSGWRQGQKPELSWNRQTQRGHMKI